ncbi:MAG: ATP-binding protein, partial [Bacteroidota bacterium]
LVDSSRNLQLLLENLLNWAKSQMNDLTISKKAFDINTLVQRNVDLFHENAIRTNVEVSYASTDVPKVYADKDMIDFVLRNLLSNALKFTKTGGSITFNVSEIDQFLEIEISDTGVGMTPEQIEDLLKSNKENKTTLGTDDEEGSGLGFAICLDFIKRNDGSIQIESEPGKGSKFIFSIPTSLTKEIILSS